MTYIIVHCVHVHSHVDHWMTMISMNLTSTRKWNWDNVSEWGDLSVCRLLFTWASTIKIQMGWYKANHNIISSKINLFLPCWKIAELTLNNNHSLTLQGNIPYYLDLSLLPVIHSLKCNGFCVVHTSHETRLFCVFCSGY